MLTALCVGALVASAHLDEAGERVLVMVLAAILIWSNITAFSVRIRPPLQEAINRRGWRARAVYYRRDILADHLRPGASVLSADPGVLVASAQTPVVFDAFMLRRLADTHPADVRRLVRTNRTSRNSTWSCSSSN